MAIDRNARKTFAVETTEDAHKIVGRFVRDTKYAEQFPDGIHALGIVTMVQSVDEKEGARVFVRGLSCEGGVGCPCGGASRHVSELEVLRDSEAFAWIVKNRRTGHERTRDAIDEVLRKDPSLNVPVKCDACGCNIYVADAKYVDNLVKPDGMTVKVGRVCKSCYDLILCNKHGFKLQKAEG